MRIFNIITLIILLPLLLGSCGSDTCEKHSFSHGWRFTRLEEGGSPEDGYHLPGLDDSGWKEVSLPHTAHIEPLVVNDQWQGICWYRKHFQVPEVYSGKKIFIELEAAMNHAKVWINGDLVTKHLGGYLPVLMDASAYIIPGAENVIAIRLNNTDNPITGPKPLKRLDFNIYGGLYRNAWLTVKEKVYISNPIHANMVAGGGIFITYPEVGEEKSLIRVLTHVVNETSEPVNIELIHSIQYLGHQVTRVETDGKVIEAGSSIEIDELIPLRDAKLWCPKDPNLYQMHTSVLVQGEIIDQESTRFGIREFTLQDGELLINGKQLFLRGVNRHQEYPFIGYALSDNAQYRDAKKIKEAGFNFVRLSHYPHAPAFMDACDELGLVVLDAILGWQYYLDNEQFREYCYRSTTDLIRRDRNHPCVLAWEASLNETQMPVFFMEELHRIVHEEYPGEHTYSGGWKDTVYDVYLEARQHRIMHGYHPPDKPYLVSEYGDWEYHSNNAGLNQHKYPKAIRAEKSSRQFRGFGEARLLQQAFNVQEAHNDNHNTTAFADGYWVMFDYNRGYHDNIEASGIMDIFRIPKFAYYFYRSQMDPAVETVLRIASYWNEESPLDLKVFSNCEEMELYLNDVLLDRQKADTGQNTEHLLHPPFTFLMDEFEPGTLRAAGYIDGKLVAVHEVHTPGKANEIKLWLDESGREPEAGVNDVLFLYVAAVDEQGTIVPDYQEVVDVQVNGDARVMNSEVIRAEAGIATVLLQIGDRGGTLRLTAESGKKISGKLQVNIRK